MVPIDPELGEEGHGAIDQVSTAGAETRRRQAMRCIDMPLKYHRTALIFVARGLPRGIVRVN